jgi:hypothetical protein
MALEIIDRCQGHSSAEHMRDGMLFDLAGKLLDALIEAALILI